MDAPRPLPVALLTALAVALLAPGAAAHTSVFTADGNVRAVIGQLNEPVSTYAVSGLDVCFQANTTARTPIAAVQPGALSATLKAPNGQTLHQDLKAQFGRPGCLTFAAPYVLTQAGQYTVDLSGDVNGSAIAVTNVAAGGAVLDRTDITFPDAQVPSNLDLQARIATLEHQVGALSTTSSATHKSPAPVAAYLMIALAALAMARRLR
jgi:hypothetical protein